MGGKGLLSDLPANKEECENLPTYDEDREKRHAEIEKLIIELRLQKLQSDSSGLFARGWFDGLVRELNFRKWLVQFALDRRISLTDADWIGAAVRERFPKPGKKGRGRPGKATGLLGHPAPDDAQELRVIERLRSLYAQHGREVKEDAPLVRHLVQILWPKLDENSRGFEAKCRSLANKVSTQRTQRGVNRRPAQRRKARAVS
jgi:hypothetical protein